MANAGNGTPVELPQRLSPSRLSDFKQCQAKFFYGSIVKLPRPSTIATTVGTLAHAAFEHVFDHPREERTYETAATYILPEWETLKVKDGYLHLVEHEEEIIRLAHESVQGWFSVERPHNFDPFGRELRLMGDVAGVPLLGILDRVDKVDVKGDEKVYISDYKGLSLDTVLPTPSGWTTMRDVRVGDFLLAADGTSTEVLEKSPVSRKPCYEMQFADGSVIVCDDVHLWGIVSGGAYMVCDARELEALYKGSEVVLGVPKRAPLAGTHVPGLDYTLAAAWLTGGEAGEVSARAALRADLVQRKAVIASLTVEHAEEEDVLLVRHIDEVRAGVLKELLATFSHPAQIDEDDEGTVAVCFATETPQWEIVGVKRCESVETACVKVAHPTGLYLAGESMIPTHNTGKVPAIDDRFLAEKFFAMRMYALLWHTLHGETPHELRLVYVKGASRDSVRKLRVDENLIDSARKELKALYSGMKKAAKAGKFECKKQPLCQWCDYMEICPAWHPELEGLTVGELRRKVIDGQDTLFDDAD